MIYENLERVAVLGWFCDARLEFFPRFARLEFFSRFLRARKNCVLKESHERVLHTRLGQARATAYGLRLPRACLRLVCSNFVSTNGNFCFKNQNSWSDFCDQLLKFWWILLKFWWNFLLEI